MKLKTIITGTTGMVGEGVLLDCLANPEVESILVINRKPGGIEHPKLREIIHGDFFDLTAIESQLSGYSACFFCLGVSSVGMSEADYKRTTYDLTINVGKTLARLNPEMTFCYVTGAGTDSSEKGGTAWARVKGATENELLRIFKHAYMFRPGAMRIVPGQKRANKYYKYFAWIYPLGRALAPGSFCTIEEVARAMVAVSTKGFVKPIVDVKEMVALAASASAATA